MGLVPRQISDIRKYLPMKKIRMPRELYEIKNQHCVVTICSKNRQNIFIDEKFIEQIIVQLRDESTKYDVRVFGFCFVPDHFHLIISSNSGYNLIGWIGNLKGKITKLSWGFGYKGTIFQKRFYDHMIRKPEDLYDHIKYIFNNPVRRNLPERHRKYPFIGSFEYDLKEFSVAGG